MSTGTGLFTFLVGGFAKLFKQIVSVRVTKLSNTNLVALRNIKRNKVTLLVEVRHTKMSLFKLQYKYYSELKTNEQPRY